MNYCYEKHHSSTSERLRLELYDKRAENHLYVLRNSVASTMSFFIEALRSDFIVFRTEKSLSTLTWVGGRAVTAPAQAASRMISG